MMRSLPVLLLSSLCGAPVVTTAFSVAPVGQAALSNRNEKVTSTMTVAAASSDSATDQGAVSFIDTEMRKAAMRLHTRAQLRPKEVSAVEPAERYVPTLEDYLKFLVDSEYVYQTLEDLTNERPGLESLRNTGMERTEALAVDLEALTSEEVARPAVGSYGLQYAEHLKSISSTPEFLCHFYNYYFAHTAGGLMIGKQMSKLLLEGRTLEFYKFDGDLAELKATVKGTIDDMASRWSPEEQQECLDATADTFRYAGAINKYLNGGKGGH